MNEMPFFFGQHAKRAAHQFEQLIDIGYLVFGSKGLSKKKSLFEILPIQIISRL